MSVAREGLHNLGLFSAHIQQDFVILTSVPATGYVDHCDARVAQLLTYALVSFHFTRCHIVQALFSLSLFFEGFLETYGDKVELGN